MKKSGLIGKTLSHSLSPRIHKKFFELTGVSGRYSLYETSKSRLGELLKQMQAEGFAGVNVTIPYKTDIIPHLDTLSDESAAIGAVNTVLFSNGKKIGHNTDYFGLKSLLDTNGIVLGGAVVFVLGTGGAARCAAALAKNEGAAEVYTVSRSPKTADENLNALSYGDLEKFDTIDVLINATPVGMSPNTDACPVDERVIEKCATIVDMIYNPAQTILLAKAAALGIKAVNGLMMLVAQAIKAQEIWTGKTYEAHVYQNILSYMQRSLQPNLVLIGMPGCGKTVIGKELAERLNMAFADTDDMIKAAHGSIQDIFAMQGERVFRQLEHQAAKQAAALSHTVISTGGGIVLDERNLTALKESGVVIYIDRPLKDLLADIDTSGRPLLAQGAHKLTSLFTARNPLYNGYADITAQNTADIDTCVTETIKQWKEYIS